jgi:hypothetical protein
MKTLKWVLAATAALAATAGVVAPALLVQPGCGSNCASDCPPTAVYIGNLNNQQLWIQNITAEGPACPPSEGLYCLGDGQTTSCTHVTVTGQAQGYCDVTIWFGDRPAEIVRTEFGGPIQKGCCRGRSIVGATVFSIPVASDAGITDYDGGTDAVRPYVEAGAETGADAVSEGGTD